MARWVAGVALLASLTWSGAASAAGYVVSEIGTKAIGRSGAFVANPDDPTAMWLNPAGLAGVPGAQVYMTNTLVRLNQTYSRTCEPSCAPTPYDKDYGDGRAVVARHPQDTGSPADGFSGDKPSLGNRGDSVGTVSNQSLGRNVQFFSMSLNGELLGVPGLGMGMAVYGPNTSGVRYPAAGPQRYSVQESIPLEILVEGALAYRFNRYFAVGLGLALERIGTEQRLAISVDKQGRELRGKDADLHLQLYEDFVPTMILGFTSNPVAGLHIGGSFIPARDASATGPVRVTPADQAALNDPNDPDNLDLHFDDSNARGRGSFLTPAVARLGIQYVYSKYFDVEVAVVREFWSQSQFIRLDIENLDVTSSLLPAGTSLPLPPTVQPKEWQDTWSVRAGGDFHVIPGVVTARSGVFAEESAIPERTFDVSVPDGRKVGVSSGLTVGYFGFRLTAAWQHIFVEARTVNETLAVSVNPVTGTLPGAGGQTAVALGHYRQSFDLASVGVTLDVGEFAVRVRGLLDGDSGWWRPSGPRNRTVVNAARLLQEHSNL